MATAASGTVSASAARQVQPSAVTRPTASGATRPTPAATALASLTAAVPSDPWWSCSTAVLTLISSAPPAPATSIAGSVIVNWPDGSSEPAMNARTPAAMIAAPPPAAPDRWKRRAAATPDDAPTMTPAASIRLCSPATALDVPNSSRTSGIVGDRPYRNHV